MHKDAFVQEQIASYGDWFLDEKWLAKGKMTQALYPYQALFEPIEINSITVKNRLVMAPMGNISMCDETGRPKDQMIQYFIARAKGGTGLLTSGLIPISFGIDHSIMEKGELTYFPRIDGSRTNFAGWRDLAAGVHTFGAKFFIQLTPGLGRVGNPQCLVNEMKFPVSASMNPNFYMPQIPCMPLSDGRLRKIIKNGGQAAADAKAAGIDGVYLHGHEGYLLEQLTNPAFNRRKLGRYRDWQAFGLELVKEIRRRVGERYPIMYRIDLSLALNETYGSQMDETHMKHFKNGRTVEMSLEYMKNLVKAGVDIFDVDLGCYDNWWLPHPPASMPPGTFLPVAKLVKDRFAADKVLSNQGKSVPIVGVGKLGYPDLAEKALRDGLCDMVMLGRPLLADPEWPNKAYAGKVKEILPCIGCQEGCINEFVEGGHPQCAVNARTSFEYLMPEDIPQTATPKKIAVIGAGPAGVNFALTARKRGHKVTLVEKDAEAGGKVTPGSVPAIKYEFGNYLAWMRHQLELVKDNENFKYKPGFSADMDWRKEKKFDALVFAGGGKEISLPLKGELPSLSGTDLLLHPEKLGKEKQIVVIGGGVVGCEIAYWLATEKKREVTVLEMTPYFMNKICTANRGYLLYYFKKFGVKLLNCTRAESLDPNGVWVERNVSPSVPNPYLTWTPILPENVENPLAKPIKTENKKELIPADLVVFAVGFAKDQSLFFEAQRAHAAAEVYQIGDGFTPGKVLEASRAANALARKI
ncbi:MAG: FAD-dependent oxidoreductase [Anaerolineaceae bacterium]|nr:FAD-dependent oxidoreductase [Anaerolineaceae bacterium]